MHGCSRTRRYAGISLRKGVCCHSAASGGGTIDCVGGTQSFGEESRQPNSRIKRSLSLSWFDRNAPESALSEMFVFDHALRNSRTKYACLLMLTYGQER
jgi:hypothetical protein